MDATKKMTGFIDEIAGLADARDRDALEYAMASVMFELMGARRFPYGAWRRETATLACVVA